MATALGQKERKMPRGTVKWFNTTKGYGFIAPEDGGKDIFVHISAVEQSGLTGLAAVSARVTVSRAGHFVDRGAVGRHAKRNQVVQAHVRP